MAERSKALRSGRSPLLWAWVRIPLLTKLFFCFSNDLEPTMALLSTLPYIPDHKKQSGAVEACWAHNPEVRRSKLRSAKYFCYNNQVPLAQRIARWTSNPKVLGSIPRWDEQLFGLNVGIE